MCDTRTFAPPRYEPSAWMRNRAAQLLRTARRDDPSAAVILAPLSGTLAEPGSREDRCCDRCGTHVPTRHTLHCGWFERHEASAIGVFFFGLCEPCLTAEIGDQHTGSERR